MIGVLFAAATYFAIVFAAGFCLGAVRELLLRPAIGATAAVAAEIPLILAISWSVAGAVLRRIPLASRTHAAAAGLAALALLLMAEAYLFHLTTGRPAQDIAGEWASAPGMIGLAAQIVFGIFPAVRWRASPSGY